MSSLATFFGIVSFGGEFLEGNVSSLDHSSMLEKNQGMEMTRITFNINQEGHWWGTYAHLQ
jgi:hypothetical protein